MTTLLDLTIPRTLDTLVTHFTDGAHAGWQVEAWLFDNHASRRAAEAKLASHGVQASFRSAYKPLIHYFLEEAPASGAVVIGLPTNTAATPERFRLEAYPLAALVGDLSFAQGSEALSYTVTIDGGPATFVFAPNLLRPDHLGKNTLSPCGWLSVRDAAGEITENGPLETEFEVAFRTVMKKLAAHDWPAKPPYFDVLDIHATIPGIERGLPCGDEVISTAEALHEDFYFGINELLKQRTGLAALDRTLQPGQIIPDITIADGPVRLTLTLRPHPATRPALRGPDDLATADRPLTPDQITTLTNAIGGTTHDITSVQGRPLLARIIEGSGPAFLLSAGQHANETSGPVGALRAAQALRAEGQHFALIACENPDGYALHHQLRARNPRHMHHAARYSALGDDVEARTHPPLHEKAARLALIAATGARLHLNLHGYPAHEWTRPLSGYLPAGFELWTIPKGFFLIFRHHPGLADTARPFLEPLTAHLAEDPALAEFNATQLKTWAAHAGAVPFPVINGIPCLITETDRQTTPYQIITEYPDETIYGDAFQLAHTTQMRTVLHAVELLKAGVL